MKKPSLEEVKEYFKNAKTVIPIDDDVEVDITKNIIKETHEYYSCYWIDISDYSGTSVLLWDNQKGYAKIITKTEPTYQITKETILKYNMKDEFPEVFRLRKDFKGWVKSNTYPVFLGYVEGGKIKYGFSINSEWVDFEAGLDGSEYEAATEEVTEALKNEAVKRYKIGDYIDNSNLKDEDLGEGNKIKGFFRIQKNDYTVWCDSTKGYGRQLLKNGIWATVIPTKTIKEAEELLNCKIV